MEFRYHPIIEGLKVNEDGSEIVLNGNTLIQFANDKSRNNPTIKVGFHNKGHSVTRLVCETWNGMPEHSGLRASKIDSLSNNHYSNLEWKEGASNGVGVFQQKIKANDIDEIIELVKEGKSNNVIAKMYGVNRATILRIKKKYGEEN